MSLRTAVIATVLCAPAGALIGTAVSFPGHPLFLLLLIPAGLMLIPEFRLLTSGFRDTTAWTRFQTRYCWPWRQWRQIKVHGFLVCDSRDGARNHGGIVNPCLRRKGHRRRHKDMWGDRF